MDKLPASPASPTLESLQRELTELKEREKRRHWHLLGGTCYYSCPGCGYCHSVDSTHLYG